MFHDKATMCKSFTPGQNVLLSKSRLHLLSGKLISLWNGPFIVWLVHHYGVIDINNSKNGNIFKANEQTLMPLLESHQSKNIDILTFHNPYYM